MNTIRTNFDWATAGTSGASEAYGALQSAIAETALQISREHVDDFPGLLEFVEDNVLFVVGRPIRRALGWFAPDTWRHGSRYATEIFVSADRRSGLDAASLAVEMATTVVHELAHARCYVDGIMDTSRQGRWHNRQFGMTALAMGALVTRHESVGHATPGLQPRALSLYSHQLQQLEQALILSWAPKPIQRRLPEDPEASGSPAETGRRKYVTAACSCTDSRGRRRTIRVASGWWEVGPITCGVCRQSFSPEP